MREFVGLAYLGGCDFLLYIKVVKRNEINHVVIGHAQRRQIMETHTI